MTCERCTRLRGDGAARIRVRTWIRASAEDIRTGMLGYISVYLDNLIVDGIAVRRTANGRYALSFPDRTSRRGQRYPIVRPVDDDARRAIEREILGQLGPHLEAGT